MANGLFTFLPAPKRIFLYGNHGMNPYYNLPAKQQRIRQLIAQFNADERLWQSLEQKRRRRRRLHPKMSAKCRRLLDLLDFASARAPEDCIGLP
jgi:hypothetical protein